MNAPKLTMTNRKNLSRRSTNQRYSNNPEEPGTPASRAIFKPSGENSAIMANANANKAIKMIV